MRRVLFSHLEKSQEAYRNDEEKSLTLNLKIFNNLIFLCS